MDILNVFFGDTTDPCLLFHPRTLIHVSVNKTKGVAIELNCLKRQSIHVDFGGAAEEAAQSI